MSRQSYFTWDEALAKVLQPRQDIDVEFFGNSHSECEPDKVFDPNESAAPENNDAISDEEEDNAEPVEIQVAEVTEVFLAAHLPRSKRVLVRQQQQQQQQLQRKRIRRAIFLQCRP